MRNYNKTNPWPGMAALALAASAMAGTAYAGIPAPALPAGVTASSDWLAVLKGYSQSGSSLLTLVLSVAVFVMLSYFMAADLSAVRKGDKEWGDLGLMAVIGAAVFMWITYLLGQVAGVFT